MGIDLVVVEIQRVYFAKWSCKTIWSREFVTLWKETPQFGAHKSNLVVVIESF